MTKKNILIAVFTFILALLVFSGGFLVGINFEDVRSSVISLFNSTTIKNSEDLNSKDYLDSDTSNSLALGIKAIEETINFIKANAISKKSIKELVGAAIEGMLASLEDKYADYFPADEYAKIMESYSGTMSGIGVVVTNDDQGRVLIISVIEGTPAFEKGILSGDIIISVEGINLKDMALDQVVALIKGKEGTDVNIKILRPSENKTIDFKITRRRFYVPNFTANIIEENIIYIRYADFQQNGAKKLAEKLDQIFKDTNNKSIEGIIIDFRNNLGGTLDDAVEVCDLFLDEGIIVTVRGRSDNIDKVEEFKATKGGYTKIPVTVLINGFSASAAELAAGALRDLGRAVLIGEKSFGKGTVQILNELPDGSGIKFTTAKYFLPSGVTIDGVGIEPDINVVLTENDKEDLQLKRAIDEIRNAIKK